MSSKSLQHILNNINALRNTLDEVRSDVLSISMLKINEFDTIKENIACINTLSESIKLLINLNDCLKSNQTNDRLYYLDKLYILSPRQSTCAAYRKEFNDMLRLLYNDIKSLNLTITHLNIINREKVFSTVTNIHDKVMRFIFKSADHGMINIIGISGNPMLCKHSVKLMSTIEPSQSLPRLISSLDSEQIPNDVRQMYLVELLKTSLYIDFFSILRGLRDIVTLITNYKYTEEVYKLYGDFVYHYFIYNDHEEDYYFNINISIPFTKCNGRYNTLGDDHYITFDLFWYCYYRFRIDHPDNDQIITLIKCKWLIRNEDELIRVINNDNSNHDCKECFKVYKHIVSGLTLEHFNSVKDM